MGVHSLTVTKVKLNGVDYSLQDSRVGREAVLLIHGWPDDGTLWQTQIPALMEAGYRVLCPDLPGYGQSEAPAAVERYQIQLLVQDLIMLLDQLGLERVHCVGHDYGAVLGWQLAAHSHRLQSYTAMSVGHLREFLKLSLENLQKQWIYFLNVHDLAPDIYRAESGALMREVLRSHPRREQIIDSILQPQVLENMTYLEQANPVPQFLLALITQQLPEDPPVQVPTLGIWSDRDDFLWESQMQNSEQYVAAEWRYERLQGAGHWFMLEKPDWTNQCLLSWLQRHPNH